MKKLSKEDLASLLLEAYKQIDDLKEQLRQAEEKLESRRILIDNSGSLADAAIKLNQVLESAQRAADQYTENVFARYRDIDRICEERIAEANERAEMLVKSAEKRSADLENLAKERAEAFWSDATLRYSQPPGRSGEGL